MAALASAGSLRLAGGAFLQPPRPSVQALVVASLPPPPLPRRRAVLCAAAAAPKSPAPERAGSPPPWRNRGNNSGGGSSRGSARGPVRQAGGGKAADTGKLRLNKVRAAPWWWACACCTATAFVLVHRCSAVSAGGGDGLCAPLHQCLHLSVPLPQAIASAGVASRRAADELVFEGKVSGQAAVDVDTCKLVSCACYRLSEHATKQAWSAVLLAPAGLRTSG